MSKTQHRVTPVPGAEAQWPRPAFVVGCYLGNDAQGRPLVVPASDAATAPRTARCLAGFVGWPADAQFARGAPALLAIDEAAGGDVVIMGLVRDTADAPAVGARTLLEQALPLKGVSADGKRVVIEASQEVVLQCGRGSITLQADGRVVIKGTELLSKASGGNRIRGATVNIN